MELRKIQTSSPIVSNYIKGSELPIYSIIKDLQPWEAVAKIETVITTLIGSLDPNHYEIKDNQAIHKTAAIESTAQIKGSAVIGPSCFVANGSLLRGGVILDANCIVGHCSELKTSIMLSGSKVAHLNFVGDSILGNGANVEAGAVIANYRNELENKEIHVHYEHQNIATGVNKFGAILGDETKVGANAVLAPGTMLVERSIVERGVALDQIAKTA